MTFSLRMVDNLVVRDGTVSFTIHLHEAGTPLQIPLEWRASKAVFAVPGVKEVQINFETNPRSTLRDTSRLHLTAKSMIAVASGKGGCGRSPDRTTCHYPANLACTSGLDS